MAEEEQEDLPDDDPDSQTLDRFAIPRDDIDQDSDETTARRWPLVICDTRPPIQATATGRGRSHSLCGELETLLERGEEEVESSHLDLSKDLGKDSLIFFKQSL